MSAILCPSPRNTASSPQVAERMALCDALKARLRKAQTTQIHLADTVIAKAMIQ